MILQEGGGQDHAGRLNSGPDSGLDSRQPLQLSNSLVLLGEKRLSWKRCGGTGGVAASRLFMMARQIDKV
jgi:hypothetical protein